jgi:hypothetical protein
MPTDTALNFDIIKIVLFFGLIAKGLYPVFFTPGKIYSSFCEKYRQDCRSNSLKNNDGYKKDRRKNSPMFPQYLPLKKLKRRYLWHTVGYCFCCAFCLIALIDIAQKLIK